MRSESQSRSPSWAADQPSAARRSGELANCALLFTVLFYVYPLKFLYTLVIASFTGESAFRHALGRPGDGVRLMTIYGLGWIAVFVIFALLLALAAIAVARKAR